MLVRCALLVVALAGAIGATGASPPPDDPQAGRAPAAVLYIGNSYTYFHHMPVTVSAMARAKESPREIHAKVLAVPAATLKRHWDSGAALSAIRERKWDYVVLQEQSLLPLEQKERMYEYVRLLDREIKLSGAKTVLFLTWARRDQPETQLALSAAYHAIAQELGAVVAPVGPAWQMARQDTPAASLYEPDGSHPTADGSYLTACVLYLTLQHTETQCPLPQGDGVAIRSVDALRAAAASASAKQRQ